MNEAAATGYSVFFWWLCGIFLLVTALLISARMGIYQEVLYKRHGKHSREALYVTVSQMFISWLQSFQTIQLILFLCFVFSAFTTVAGIFTAVHKHCRSYSHCECKCTGRSACGWCIDANSLDTFNCRYFNALFMHQLRICADNGMHIANRHTSCYTTQIYIVDLFNCLLPKSVYHLSLVWYGVGVHWNGHFHRTNSIVYK